MAEVVGSLLQELAKCENINSIDLSQRLGTSHQNVVGAVKSLQALGNVRILVVVALE